MKAMTLRGIDNSLERALRERAERASSSVNATILAILRESTGLARPSRRRAHHDLDHLAGTWSDADVREFGAAIDPLAQIDEELWK